MIYSGKKTAYHKEIEMKIKINFTFNDTWLNLEAFQRIFKKQRHIFMKKKRH